MLTEEVKKKNVTFNDHDSSDSEDGDSDFTNELRLRFKKRKRSVRKVANTSKNDGKNAKTEYSGDESESAPGNTEIIPPSLKAHIEKIIESNISNLETKGSQQQARTPPSPRNPAARSESSVIAVVILNTFKDNAPK